ncbi:inactive rhomboid protein 2-like [Sycon ciliatum]|uniref:inactive rhomboid protein 2-like n=1 Tax=Sycon ciliatum TaxID=27933 RepID=UPI0031F6C89B
MESSDKFKADIKRLSKDDRSFAEGIFRHKCPRNQKKGLNLEQCRKAIEECKRKITIPPSAVSRLYDLFADVGEGRDTVDANEFLAILSRMLHDSDAARRHKNRKAYGMNTFEGSVSNFKRVATNVGHNVGTFLGVLDSADVDPSLEIFQERERRLTQRRTMDRRRPPSGMGKRQTLRHKAMKIVPRLPGSNIFEADYDDDPEEQPLELGDDDIPEQEVSFMGASHTSVPEHALGLSFNEGEEQSMLSFRSTETPKASNRRFAPPLPGQDDGAPALPGRNAGAPPLPGRDAGAPPLPGRDAGAPPLPGRDAGAPPLPGRDAGAPPLPGRDTGAPSLPGRGTPAPPLPGDNSSGPPLPGRDSGAPALPGRDAGAPALPSRDGKAVGDSAPALPSRGKVDFSNAQTDPSAPPLPGRGSGGDGADGVDVNVVPLPKRDYGDKQDFIESREEALAYYRRRAAKEKSGGGEKKDKKSATKEAEESFKNARTKSVKDRVKQKFMRKKVETMPVFSPWMIYVLTYSQLIVLIILVYRGNFEKIAFIPKFVNQNVSTLTGGSGFETVGYFEQVNFWIGPSALKLIQHGVVYSPCMRKDHTISARYRKMNAIDRRPEGCCVKTISNVGRGVYTTDRKCSTLFIPSTFYPKHCDQLLNQRVFGNDHSACCYGLLGHCQMLTRPDCAKLGGNYHRNQTCLKVNCLEGLCGFGGLQASAAIPYEPVSSNQWWRFFTSLFVHQGIIHAVLVCAAQLYIGRRIERSAGWLRIGLIYIVSGMMSNVAAGYANPYQIMTGASGALCGLLAVLFVELFNMWSLLKDPVNEFTSLCFYLIVVFIIGTLPGLNNFAHLAGFVFGLLMSVLLLPYVSFGKWAIRRKRIIAGVSFTLLVIFIITLLLFFSLIQSSEFCTGCHHFNCIDYVANLCAKFVPPSASSFVLYSPAESLFYQNA